MLTQGHEQWLQTEQAEAQRAEASNTNGEDFLYMHNQAAWQ